MARRLKLRHQFPGKPGGSTKISNVPEPKNKIMLKTYLLTAYRTLIRNKSYSFLNVLGLTLGITCSILLFLVIKYELSFDKFHAKADRIYRVGLNVKIEGTPEQQVAIPVPATALLRENNP